MARKVLIGFIGTGMWIDRNAPINERKYKPAKYRIDGQIKESSFIASVLADHLKVDCIYLIGTMKSMWEEVYQVFSQKNQLPLDENYWLTLAQKGSEANYKTPIDVSHLKTVEKVLGNDSKVCVIKYGIDETELLDNFQVMKSLFEQLQPGDEVYLDITHAFRSIPLLATTILMYVNDVLKQKTTIKGVYYGMLDAMSEFDGIAPVVNLNQLLKIQDWIKGAYALNTFGNASLISELISDVDDVKNKWKNISAALFLNYAQDVKKHIDSLSINTNDAIGQLILPKVAEQLKRELLGKRNESLFQIALARWYFEKNMPGYAYIVLAESIITFFCEKKSWDITSKPDRDNAKKLVRDNQDFKRIFSTVNDIRNSIAHASLEYRLNALHNDTIQLKNRIEKVEALFKANKTI